jgi:hypothetical protein
VVTLAPGLSAGSVPARCEPSLDLQYKKTIGILSLAIGFIRSLQVNSRTHELIKLIEEISRSSHHETNPA